MTNTTDRYTTDNTTGYTNEQLTELNNLFQVACGGFDAAELADKSLVDRISEAVLTRFDTVTA